MVIKCIAILLFAVILVKQIMLLKDLIVATKKTNFEKATIVFGMILLLFLVYRFAATLLDYVFAVIAIITILAMFFKQGITSKGLTIYARGKETYEWTEISEVRIEDANDIIVTFFSTIGSPIIKQHYAKKNKEKLQEIFEKNIENNPEHH